MAYEITIKLKVRRKLVDRQKSIETISNAFFYGTVKEGLEDALDVPIDGIQVDVQDALPKRLKKGVSQ